MKNIQTMLITLFILTTLTLSIANGQEENVNYPQEFDRTQKVKITHNEDITVGYILSYDTIYCLVEIEDKNNTILRILTKDIKKIEPYQKTSEDVKIILNDKTEYFGKIIQEDSLNITIKTENNLTITIPKENITYQDNSLITVQADIEYRRDPNSARLFFAPTAKSIPASEVTLTIFEIFFPAISVGIADVVTLNGGISILPTGGDQLFYLASKVTFVQSDMFSAAAGFAYANITSFNSNSSNTGEMVFFGVGTLGNEKMSLTAGLGLFNVKKDPSTIFLIGADLRVSRRVKLITENYIIPTQDYWGKKNNLLISFGIRFFGGNLSGDFGLIQLIEGSNSSIPFPWLGFGYTF